MAQGPLPKTVETRINRRRLTGRMRLPAGGRKGRTPSFPLPDATDRERALWRQLWRTPQAVAWERLDLGYQVAMYCRATVRAESDPTPNALGEARRMATDLGLNAPGLRRLEWVIEDDAGPDPVGTSSGARPGERERERGDGDGTRELYGDLRVTRQGKEGEHERE